MHFSPDNYPRPRSHLDDCNCHLTGTQQPPRLCLVCSPNCIQSVPKSLNSITTWPGLAMALYDLTSL